MFWQLDYNHVFTPWMIMSIPIYIRLAIYHKQIFQLGVISYGILKFYHEVKNTPVQQVLCIYHMGVFDRWDSITKLILHRDHLEISSFVHVLKRWDIIFHTYNR